MIDAVRRAAMSDRSRSVTSFRPVSSGFVSRNLVAFRENHPDVMLQLRRLVTFEQFRALTDDTLDVGFTAAPQSYPAGLTGFVVDRQPLLCRDSEAQSARQAQTHHAGGPRRRTIRRSIAGDGSRLRWRQHLGDLAARQIASHHRARRTSFRC